MRQRLFLAMCMVALGQVTPGWSQTIVPQFKVISCGYADSLLGTDWEKDDMIGGRDPDGLVFMSSRRPGPMRTTIDLNVSVEYRDSLPLREPFGSLQVTVMNDRGLAQAMLRPDTTELTLVLDDTVTLNLGSPIEGDVQGATRGGFLPVNVNLPRRAFLALALARKGRATVAGRTYPIARAHLKAVDRIYRAAVCMDPDSLPRIGGSQ
jgi:hypothetical protein